MDVIHAPEAADSTLPLCGLSVVEATTKNDAEPVRYCTQSITLSGDPAQVTCEDCKAKLP